MSVGKFFKWLRPGLRIKRWISVIFLGLLFAVLASWALLLFFGTPDGPKFDRSTVWGYGISSGNALLIGAAMGYSLSGFCLITGIYRLIKSMWDLVDRRGARKGLVEAAYERAVLARGPKVVAIGGGTGLSCVLTGLKEHSRDVTAIVSMADDGGSSGKLRQELGINPPGDIRKCLIALADEEPLMSELLDFRFPENELGGHNFGNLFLTALARIRGDFGEGVREANRILSVRGQVLPSTLENVMLVATHEDDSKTTGQALISKTEKRIKKLELRPEPQPVAKDIVRAIEEADLIVIGPGSLYTSVIPNLLIKGTAEALAKSKAKKVFVSNIMTYEGETRGYDLADFLKAIDEHTYPHRIYDYVLVNNGKHGDTGILAVNERNAKPVRYDSKQFAHSPFKLICDDIVNPAFPIRHDTLKLAHALVRILNG
ncbi:MAG TPA: gluconeogenesis factor YvcK family protein [Planctomycetota bacterium]|nr:gluconeogenesis factor YvcK family protein [Planctomycetota bacterium]